LAIRKAIPRRRRGQDNPRHGESGWYGDREGHSEASRRGWDNPHHGESGWYGDPEGHSETSRRGWKDVLHLLAIVMTMSIAAVHEMTMRIGAAGTSAASATKMGASYAKADDRAVVMKMTMMIGVHPWTRPRRLVGRSRGPFRGRPSRLE